MGLKLEHVSFAYAEGTSYEQPALEDVSLELGPGLLLVVIGATGSGKSTLLRVASGLVQPTRGAVSVDGSAAGEPGDIGIVFQNAEAQLFGETVADDVAFGPRNLGAGENAAREAASRALAQVGLPAEEFANRSPFALSGGEARRVAVAGVLAMEPRYLLMDEPTAGLDRHGTAAIVGVVAEAKKLAGVMVVTHDPEDFLPSADGVLILSEGRVTFSGTVPEMLGRPEVVEACGLSLPEVARAQVLASEKGRLLPPVTLDPVEAAHRLLAASEARS